MNVVLTIAGSDCSGGAGIQADIKTMTAHGIYAMSAITALTAQNTMGIQGVFECDPPFLEKQLDSVFTDIFPDSVKIGMVGSAALISVIANKLKQYQARNIVLDPIMVSTSGSQLLSDDAVDSVLNLLVPLATVLTPNINEAQTLSGILIKSPSTMEEAASIISQKCNVAVLLKGGHNEKNSDDLLYYRGNFHWYTGVKIKNRNTHGTGCTLSTAIACGLAKGFSLEESIEQAKEYITGAIQSNLNLGKGNGPLNHCFKIGERNEKLCNTNGSRT